MRRSWVLLIVLLAATAAPAQTTHSDLSDFSAPLLLAILLAVYLFPVLVAWYRRVAKPDGIAVVNLFLGWTLIGWVVALAWALSGETKAQAKEKAAAAAFDYDKMAEALVRAQGGSVAPAVATADIAPIPATSQEASHALSAGRAIGRLVARHPDEAPLRITPDPTDHS